MGIQSYRDLEVWQLALDLTDLVYAVTDHFPREEQYGLTSQMRRCAVSIASNIAEGSARGSTRELMQFLYISRGSLAELETQAVIASRRHYLSDEDYRSITEMSGSVNRMLARLLQSLERKTA